MIRNAGIYLILVSFILTTIGGVLKIKHASGSDVFLAFGMIAFVIGFGIVLYKLSQGNRFSSSKKN